MPPYMHGNLAVRRKQEEVRYVETKKVVRRKAGIPAREKLLYLLMISFCFVVAGVIIWNYANIYDVNTKAQQMNREIIELNRSNEMLNLEVRELSDPGRIMEMGKAMGFKSFEEQDLVQLNGSQQEQPRIVLGE